MCVCVCARARVCVDCGAPEGDVVHLRRRRPAPQLAQDTLRERGNEREGGGGILVGQKSESEGPAGGQPPERMRLRERLGGDESDGLGKGGLKRDF